MHHFHTRWSSRLSARRMRRRGSDAGRPPRCPCPERRCQCHIQWLFSAEFPKTNDFWLKSGKTYSTIWCEIRLERVVQRQIDQRDVDDGVRGHLLQAGEQIRPAAEDSGEGDVVDQVLADAEVGARERGEGKVAPQVEGLPLLDDLLRDGVAGRALEEAGAECHGQRGAERGAGVAAQRRAEGHGQAKHRAGWAFGAGGAAAHARTAAERF